MHICCLRRRGCMYSISEISFFSAYIYATRHSISLKASLLYLAEVHLHSRSRLSPRKQIDCITTSKYQNTKIETDMQSFFRDINFDKFTPVLEGYVAYAYIGAIILVAILTAVVQRAVFLTFDRLGQRHINEIIVPVLVSNTMFENHPKCLTIVILNYSQF